MSIGIDKVLFAGIATARHIKIRHNPYFRLPTNIRNLHYSPSSFFMTNDINSASISLSRYHTLLEVVNGIVWEADADTLEFTFISDSVTRILGFTPAEWLSHPQFWENHIYPDDRERTLKFLREDAFQPLQRSFDYRIINAGGDMMWIRDMITVLEEPGKPRLLRGYMVNVTESRLQSHLDRLEKEALGMNARCSADIETILTTYVLGLEQLFPQMKCSILRLTDGRLSNWASPSLPAEYTSLIKDKTIGPLEGSCGAAAHFRKMIITNDIEHDAIWAAHKEFPLRHNLRASWSYPIIGSSGEVMATFGMYYDRVTEPGAMHVAIITRCANIIKIILENHRYGEMMQEANTLMSQGQALANFGTWQWDIITDNISWSDALYDIYEITDKSVPLTFEGYLNRLHPDDRPFVSQQIRDSLISRQDANFEERILCAGQRTKHLRSWARVITNESGTAVKMIGACLDITRSKTDRAKMDEIAWMQSHVIRAPLARIMGLVYMMQDEQRTTTDGLDILSELNIAAHELDKVIHNITDNTRS